MYQNKKKYFVLICLSIMFLIGTSYALWIQNLYQDDENTMATSCFSVSLEQANTISLKNAYPIYDEDGKKLTPYTFTIKSNCEAYATYQVNLELLNSSTLTNPEFIKVMLDSHAPVILSSKEVTQKTIDNATTAYKLVTDGLDVNESKTYELRLWIDDDVTLEDNIENSKFVAQIGITASYSESKITAYDLCVQKYGNDSTQCQILLAESDASLCPSMNGDITDGRPAIETSQSLLCSAPDDYGTSYYFRGVPENNWVKFGGYYWRIIRINGDDSVRMIYAGDASVIDALDETTKTTVMSNGYDDSSTLYTQIGTSKYNQFWKKDNIQEPIYSQIFDNAGIGYMYGNRNGIVEGSAQNGTESWTSTDVYYISKEYNYNENTDRFTLKEPIPVLASEMTSNYVDYYTFNTTSSTSSTSYVYKITSVSVGESSTTVGYSYVTYGTTSKLQAQTNINDSDIKVYLDSWYATNLASYSEYISDTLFCNDRSLGSNVAGSEAVDYNQLAFGTNPTKYKWASSTNGIRLTCSQKNDRFTVDDEVVGNGDLTYPIGLPVADEIYIIGGSRANTSYYLYTGYEYWTMSPIYYINKNSHIRVMSNVGYPNLYVRTTSEVFVRPVINLKPNVLKSGNGTASNPYKIEE